MKLIHIILTCLIVNLSISTHASIRDSDTALMDELKAKKQDILRVPYRFGCKVFQDIADQLGFPFEQRVQTSLELSQRSEKIFDQMKVGVNSIPLNHHRIWLTNPENPVEMPASMMHFYLESLDHFSSSWRHFFWCLNPHDIPETVKTLSERGVVVLSVYSEIYQEMLAKPLFDVYLSDGHFSLAANILRQNILYARGGLYADVGTEILMDPRILMGNYDYIWSVKTTDDGSSYIDQDLCAACPRSALQSIFLSRLERIPAVHEVYRIHLKSPKQQVSLIEPPHLMLVIDEMLKEKDPSLHPKFLFLNEGNLFNRNGQSSWADGKFGGKSIEDLMVNVFDIAVPPSYEAVFNNWRTLWAERGYISSVTQILHPKEWHILEKSIRQKRIGSLLRAQKRLLTLRKIEDKKRGIPLISHRIWITPSDGPHEVQDVFLEQYFQSLKVQTGDWRHFFWCLDPERIPETIKKLQRSPQKIEVHRLSEIFPEMKGKFIFDFYMAHALWALAKDIASYNIVWKYGGLYSDIGMKLNIDVQPYLRAFDIIFSNNQFYPGTSFFGLREQDSDFGLYLSYIDQLKKVIPSGYQGWPLERALDLHKVGGLIYFVDELMSSDAGLLLVPDNTLFKKNSTGSWKGQGGKFGSRGVADSAFKEDNFFRSTLTPNLEPFSPVKKEVNERLLLTEKIALFVHGGIPKTGNTAARKILHSMADNLATQGLLVPKIPFHSGDNQLAFILRQNPGWFCELAQEARRKVCHSVFLFSENLFEGLPPAVFLEKAQPYFTIQFSFCVRGLYPYLYTWYQETRKADAFEGSFVDFVNRNGQIALRNVLSSFDLQVPITLVNYDIHKHDIVSTIFSRNGIAVDWSKVEQPRIRSNRSPSASEWAIMEVFRHHKCVFSAPWVCKFWKALEAKSPSKTPLRFYDIEADRVIHELFREPLGRINSFLPDSEKLPTTPYQPEGYIMEWDSAVADPEDVKTAAEVYGIQEYYENREVFERNRGLFPEGFDPYTYVANGRLELLPLKIDPFKHFLSERSLGTQ